MFYIKFFYHLRTICRHRHCVIKHCYKAGILWRGLLHDLSKFSPAEFFSGVHYYLGTRSPNEAEREERGYSAAWMHHKGRNKHHFEYWTDYKPEARRVEPVKMPLIYVVEMFCDRVAASKIYQGINYTNSHPIEYFLRGKPNRVIHPETSDLLEKLLVMLSDKGEKETFKYIKEFIKSNKEY